MPVTLKQQRDYCPLDAACWPLTPFGLEPGLLCWRTRFFSVRLFLLLASTAGQVEKMRARYKHACSMRILLECIMVQVSTMMQSIASKQLCLSSSRRGSDHPLSSAFGGARDRRMVRLFFDITRRRGLFEPIPGFFLPQITILPATMARTELYVANPKGQRSSHIAEMRF